MKAPMEKSDGGLVSSGMASPAAAAAAWSAATVRSRAVDFVALAKPRISALVLVVTAVGFCLGSPGDAQLALLAAAVAGTGLVAVGSNALNQYLERDFDRRMARTVDRPLPAGRVAPSEALSFGLAAVALGTVSLLLSSGLAAAGLAALSAVLYLLAYTPLKRRTVLNTLVGAVPGALPPVIGYAAAAGRVDAAGWTLFAVVFVWQLPHFFAIAWLYRDDYARGGYRMLPAIDPDGSLTARCTRIGAAILLPVSLTAALVGAAGSIYVLGAVALGLALLATGVVTMRHRTAAGARRMVIATVIYLPLLMALLLFDRIIG